MRIAIAADHAGYQIKDDVINIVQFSVMTSLTLGRITRNLLTTQITP